MIQIILKIIKYGMKDFIKSRWGLIYFLAVLLITEGMFRFSGQSVKAVSGLMSVTIFLVPLISVIFGAMYYYNSRDFIELLLTQPVGRRTVYSGLFWGLAFSMAGCFAFGLGLPMLWRLDQLTGMFSVMMLLIICGVFLTFIFVGISFWISVINEDKGRGLGIALLIWLLLAVIYDGMVLFVVFLLNEYPLEQPLIIMMFANPIDLARVLLLMKIDMAALMGYTGAVFQMFFGSTLAQLLSLISLGLWTLFPFYLGLRKFKKIDF